MFGAIQRLILISIGTLCVTFLAVLFVRWAGSQQGFAPPPHPWFEIPQWTLYEPLPSELCLNKTVPSQVKPEWLVWVRVHNTAQGWSVKCETHVPLKTLLENSRHPNWLVFVDGHNTMVLEPLIKELTAFDKTKSFGIFTPSQIVARYLRKKAPQWVYGADAATLLRLHMFSGFWLETAFDFWPDFVVQTPGDKNTHLSQRELSELQRRKKRVIQTR